MFAVNEMAISITRGDTATIEITFDGDTPGEDDTVIASLKRSTRKKDEAIWEKTLTMEDDGKFLLNLASEDTENLAYGSYFWDLRILYSDGQITTPFAPAKFNVLEVVTDLPA